MKKKWNLIRSAQSGITVFRLTFNKASNGSKLVSFICQLHS